MAYARGSDPAAGTRSDSTFPSEVRDDSEGPGEGDPQSWVPARERFRKNLVPRLRAAASQGYSVYLVLIDLDRFKHFNDNFGPRVGDTVLEHLEHQIRGMLREGETACRWGDDAFAAVLPRIGYKRVRGRIDVLQHSFARLPHDAPGGDWYQVSCSVGLGEYDGSREPPGRETCHRLITSAERALARVQRALGNPRKRRRCARHVLASPLPLVLGSDGSRPARLIEYSRWGLKLMTSKWLRAGSSIRVWWPSANEPGEPDATGRDETMARITWIHYTPTRKEVMAGLALDEPLDRKRMMDLDSAGTRGR